MSDNVMPHRSAPQAEDDGSALQAYLRKAHLAKARLPLPPRAAPPRLAPRAAPHAPCPRRRWPPPPQIEAEAEEQRLIDRLNADPFDIDAQRKIEELIAQKNVHESYMQALEARLAGGWQAAEWRSEG